MSLGLTLTIVLVSVAYYKLKYRDLPPGPIGLPYIGYWPFLYSQDAHLQMQALKDKYGHIFSFTSFGRLYVNFGSIKLLREAHIGKSECFAGRFRDFNVLAYVFKDGIGFLNEEQWKELRKFILLILRERGIVSFKDNLSGSMYEAIKSTVDLLNAKKEEPVNIIEIMTSKCSSILRRMLFGEDGMSEEQVQELVKIYEAVMRIMQPKNMTLTGEFSRKAILHGGRHLRSEGIGMIAGLITSISPVPLALTLIAVLIAVAFYNLKNRDLPPGPIGLPYVGYWPFLYSQDAHVQMEAFKKKYGDIFSFTSFGRLYINLGSFKAVREAHIGKAECFGGRFTDFNLLSYVFRDGVGFLNGEPWKELRKFFLQALKERGVITVKDSLSGSMYEAIKSTVEFLKEKKEEPVNIIEIVNRKCNAILRQMLFGENGMSEEQMRELIEIYEAIMQIQTPKNLTLTGDIPRYFSTYNEENIRDIIDDYFKERDARRSKGDPTARYFTDKALMSTLKQIVGDGVLAVAAFVCLIIKILLDHPEEQTKVYEEIVDVVGTDRQPTIEDKNKLTYTNAFILEALRTSDFFAYSPSLECTKETNLRGYRIPKGAITVVQIYSSHYDPEVYEEPEKFNPSRYVLKDAKKRPELPITFGVGKRSCIGEGFTMMQIFLFLTTIIKNFELALPKGVKTTTFEDLITGKLLLVARPRNDK
ncbi:Cytochrome P450 2F3 like protein [Argiope bruennichi]|uniref:Cytochrome P450 2F3 like protein n=1 Tax=Argiope bruennichi TaxID=94029 RepID=A0A8T0E1J1_ARGBR|nr:Cytochrome P450 2F3 like protein [Argiope bruennichi]